MMPLEIQLQTVSQSGAVMIRTVGKALIWKQRVRGVTKCVAKAEAESVSPRLATAKYLTDPPQHAHTALTC